MLRKIAATLLLAGIAFAADQRWSHMASDNVKWMRVTEAGGFVYGTEAGLYSVDAETGKKVWSREDLKKIQEFNVEEAEGTPLLFVSDNTGVIKTKSRLVAIDMLTGTTAWETEKLPGSIVDLVTVNSKGMVLIVTIGPAIDCSDPGARNSKRLPVKANGLVRLRSPGSVGSAGRVSTPMVSIPFCLDVVAPPLAIWSKTSVS